MTKNPDEIDETTELNSWITQQFPLAEEVAASQPGFTVLMNGLFKNRSVIFNVTGKLAWYFIFKKLQVSLERNWGCGGGVGRVGV